MTDKLQELTDKLYNEGLSKGREEGERILARAREEAAETVSAANKEAERINAEALARAAAIKSKAESDVKMASALALQATKSDIENLLLGSICSPAVGEALADPDFVKETISAVASKFSATQGSDLKLILPESLQKDLEPWVKGELTKALGACPKAEFSKKVGGGFCIGPADGSYYISLTEDTFRSLIAEYMRPVTRKLLFGE